MQMAPQNSTMIHETNGTLVANEILIRYSPIPLATTTTATTAITMAQSNQNDCCDSADSADDYDGVVRRRKKSIHNISDVDTQADDEVPIWICGEPRFISGITSTTTCNELIQALIDDELSSTGNDVAASRDLNDYVITEKWRDVEQALPGGTHILPIWVAWGNARNEVKFKLKINKKRAGTQAVVDHHRHGNDDDVQKQNKQLKNRKMIALAQMLRRLIQQGETIRDQLATINDSPKASKRSRTQQARNILMQTFLCDTLKNDFPQKMLEPATPVQTTKSLPKVDDRILQSPDDELFLLIDDENSNDSGVHVEYRQYCLNRKLDLAIEAAKNHKTISSFESTPKRTMSRRKLQFDGLRQNSLNDRLIKYMCSNSDAVVHSDEAQPDDEFTGIRREIEMRMIELHELIAYEEMLTQQLTEQCEKYHRLNSKYMSKMHFEMCVDEVQRCLDLCAKEIIRCELELQRVKDDIHEKCGILYNLQRMIQANTSNTIRMTKDESVAEHIRWSESINNKSMII